MTKEEKELLLKDLCARLPYCVITKNCKNNFNVPAHLLPHVNGIKLLIAEYDLKPYLRPMSSMTDDEKKEYDSKRKHICDEYNRYCFDTIESIDWLNSHHFDYRGLIPMGLALEAPEDIYK